MLENLISTALLIAPFFVYLLLGMFLRRAGILDDEFSAAINGLIFRLFLPVNFFRSMYTSDIRSIFGTPAASYAMIATFVIMFAMTALSKKMSPDPAQQGALVHTVYQGNFMMFSLPIAQSMTGSAPQVLMILTALLITVNFTSVPLMEHYAGRIRAYKGEEGAGKKTSFGELLIRLLRVPLVDAVLLGAVWSLLGIPMPSLGEKVVAGIAGCVVPLAFIAMGARLDLAHMKANSRLALRQVFLKLVIIPALVMIVPVAAGWDRASLAALIAAFGAPSAVVSVSTCESYGCDGELAAEVVTMSSFFALFTIFIWIFCLRQAGVLA